MPAVFPPPEEVSLAWQSGLWAPRHHIHKPHSFQKSGSLPKKQSSLCRLGPAVPEGSWRGKRDLTWRDKAPAALAPRTNR